MSRCTSRTAGAGGVASTIVDVTGERPRVLRLGALELADLRTVVPDIVAPQAPEVNTHPSLEYLLVACVAAAVTFLLTPIARQIAIRWKAVARPRDRDVHAVATPRMGGLALFAGFALGLFVAARLPEPAPVVRERPGHAVGHRPGAVICAVGLIDDRYELDSVTKLAGQVLAGG